VTNGEAQRGEADTRSVAGEGISPHSRGWPRPKLGAGPCCRPADNPWRWKPHAAEHGFNAPTLC
jgi:hypothetical protein